MKEIESPVKRANKYLRSAEMLFEEGDYESSVSRTYYAMFYCTQALLLTKRLSYSSHKSNNFCIWGTFCEDRDISKRDGKRT